MFTTYFDEYEKSIITELESTFLKVPCPSGWLRRHAYVFQIKAMSCHYPIVIANSKINKKSPRTDWCVFKKRFKKGFHKPLRLLCVTRYTEFYYLRCLASKNPFDFNLNVGWMRLIVFTSCPAYNQRSSFNWKIQNVNCLFISDPLK